MKLWKNAINNKNNRKSFKTKKYIKPSKTIKTTEAHQRTNRCCDCLWPSAGRCEVLLSQLEQETDPAAGMCTCSLRWAPVPDKGVHLESHCLGMTNEGSTLCRMTSQAGAHSHRWFPSGWRTCSLVMLQLNHVCLQSGLKGHMQVRMSSIHSLQKSFRERKQEGDDDWWRQTPNAAGAYHYALLLQECSKNMNINMFTCTHTHMCHSYLLCVLFYGVLSQCKDFLWSPGRTWLQYTCVCERRVMNGQSLTLYTKV